jgi:hypothetical protein
MNKNDLDEYDDYTRIRLSSTEKLLKKQFKIKSEEELFRLIESKPDDFFRSNFFTDKSTYLKMIKSLVYSINRDGADYSQYMAMARSGSIFESAETSMAVGEIMKVYQANRKTLVNHVRFFIK